MSLDKHDSSPVANLDTKEHVSTSIYMASEAFNMLRKELYDHWREDPGSPSGKDLWYYSGLMVTNPPAFVEIMCVELGMVFVGFDSGDEAGTCLRILNALRERRGAQKFATD